MCVGACVDLFHFQSSDIETFRLFQSTDDGSDKPSIGGLGFLDFPVTPLPPPPPSVEVLPSEVREVELME